METFVGFSKIPRLFRDIVITEKIDGTNGQVYVATMPTDSDIPWVWTGDGLAVAAGSKSRYITPAADNYSFAKWVQENAPELAKLGPGRHFGEWWGQGIQRNYGLKEKRFSLFNVTRWSDPAVRPECCHVVPVLWEGNFDTWDIRSTILTLRTHGSKAVPGYMNPEGVVVFHKAGNLLFKVMLENDNEYKGERT